MKKTLNLFTLIFMVAAFAVSISAQKPKTTSSCPSDIKNLRVTFRDDVNDRFRSDGGGSYQTEKTRGSNIEIMLQRANCSYDLTMNLNFSPRTAKLILDQPVDGGAIYPSLDSEFFNFDRVGSVPVTSWDDAAFVAFCGGALNQQNVVKNADGTYKYDNYGGCGVDADGTYYVRRAAGIQAGDDSRGFRFQNSPIDGVSTLAAATSYIRVYHPNATTWYISPEVMSYESQGMLWNKTDNTNMGHYKVPFFITVNQF